MRRVVTVAVLLAAVATVVVAAPADAHQKGTDGCSVPYIGVGRADRGSNWDFHDECDWHDLAYVYHWYGHSETARKAADDRWRDLMVWDCYSRHRNLPWWNPWPRQDCQDGRGVQRPAARPDRPGHALGRAVGRR
jgi:hypothetical protein